MRRWWILGLLGLWAVSAACSKECSTSADCGGGMKCTVDGECMERDVVVPMCVNPDGCTPDAGPRDAGFRDAGRDGGPCLDDGGPCDAGFIDAGRDGGPRDAGFVDAAVNGARGTLWIREQTSGSNQSEYVVYAELVDESQAVYDETVTTFPDNENTSCDLTVRTLMSGAPQPILTDRIEIDLGGGLATIVLTHTADGRYDPAPNTTFTRRMFAQAMNPTVTMISGPGGAVFTNGSAPIPIPVEVEAVVPAPGTSASLTNPVSWMVPPVGVPVVVEASDRDREVVLTCYPFNDGGYTVPFNAQQGWAAESRTDPQILEIRRDSESVAQAIVPGVGYVPVRIRTAWGPVFRLSK